MCHRRFACCAVVAVLCLVAGAGTTRGANLVPNPGFETGDPPAAWTLWPAGKTSATLETDREVFKEGKAAARIVHRSAADRATLYTGFGLAEKTCYTLRFYYRLKDFQVSGQGEPTVDLAFCKEGGANGSAGQQRFRLPIPGPQMEWSEFVAEFRTPPATATVQCCVVSCEGVTGTLWVDDVRVEEVIDTLPVKRVAAAPAIDGRLDDACWQDAVPLEHFYSVDRQAAPAVTPTTALLAYDSECLYVALRNVEPRLDLLACATSARDGAVYLDDCDEIFIAVPNGHVYQFIVNCGNTQWDGELYVRVPGDPWSVTPEWNGEWQSATRRGEGEWVLEVRLPWALFGGSPKAGDTWQVNLARERHGAAQELTHWNRMDGSFNNVGKFASLRFADQAATLTRFTEDVVAEPLGVERPSPRFAEVLGEKPGGYIVGSWASGCYTPTDYPKLVADQYTPEKWAQEQANILAEMGEAGMFGPAFPWVDSRLVNGGMAALKELHERYGMKFPFVMYTSSHDRKAVADGASFVHSESESPDSVDPVLAATMQQYIVDYFGRRQDVLPYLAFFSGRDEPLNCTFNAFSLTINGARHGDALRRVDEEIRRDFGFGKYGLYDQFAPATNAPEAPFRRIAFCRWWNARYAEVLRAEQALVRQAAPGVPYLACNFNATSSFNVNDVTLTAQHTDWVSADPYPTATLAWFGRERALYHTGFTTKVIRDLSGNRTTCIMPQAFTYHGRSPTPASIREWASQCLKNGAEVLYWYDSNPVPARRDLPEMYAEMLRLNRLISGMKRLKLPETTRTAILYANTSVYGTMDAAQHSWYALYVLLGERLKTWFRFVSDTQLALSPDALADYRLLYVPQLAYCDAATAARLAAFVERGGTLVVLDPEALQWGIDGTPLAAARAQLLGGALGARRAADHLVLGAKGLGYGGLPAGEKLALWPVRQRTGEGSVMAYDVSPPADALVFAAYADGKPAAYRRKVGQGQVLYFAAQPFGDSAAGFQPGPWLEFCRGLARGVDESQDLPIWDFLLPRTGGEVKVRYVIAP